jgi:hypothetical protein
MGRAKNSVVNNYIGTTALEGICVGPNVIDARINDNKVVNDSYGVSIGSGADYNIYPRNNIRRNTNAWFDGTAVRTASNKKMLHSDVFREDLCL